MVRYSRMCAHREPEQPSLSIAGGDPAPIPPMMVNRRTTVRRAASQQGK
jgi:hypothetical protein